MGKGEWIMQKWIKMPVEELLVTLRQYAAECQYCADALAKKCEICKRYLQIVFKQRLKTTLQKWINELRMEKAAELLPARSRIKDVVKELNYSNSSQFSRAFKKSYGCTPSEYQVRQSISV